MAERNPDPPVLARPAHPHDSAHLHVTGAAIYADDGAEPEAMLHLAFGLSREAHARIVGMDLSDVFLVRGIDKEADYGNGIARANHLPGQGVSAHAVIGGRGVLILIDDLHPHEALTGVR